MNILFYTPLNTRCRDIESQSIEFKKKGHRIFLLTQGSDGELHANFSAYGYTVAADRKYSSNTKWLTLIRWIALIRYCSKFNIDVIYAHLEPANFIAILAQYFIKGRVIICRHHVDEAKLYPFGKDLSYRLTYALAKDIIVVSERARQYMIEEEKIPTKKIHVIKLSYDFSLYALPDRNGAREIRSGHPCEFLLLSVFRLTRFKRPELAISVVEKLLKEGINIKLIILGRGEEQDRLIDYIKAKNLQSNVFLKGFVSNVFDYMAAADLLLHPSLLDSSSITFKEASLVGLPMIACDKVGDFSDVITSGFNGFLVDPDKFVEQSTLIIKKHIGRSELLKTMGERSRQYVLKTFDIKQNTHYYERVFHSPLS